MLPGGGAMHLNDALACQTRITPVACHHEQACGIAAEAYGRTENANPSGFGVALVTTGPGATNLVTPLAGAWIESLPLFIISGQVKRADRLKGRPIRQGGVQEVDIIPLVDKITKYAATVEDPNDIKSHFETALASMRSGRPGPVWLEVPLDVQGAYIDESTESPSITSHSNQNLENTNQISELLSLLGSAERPLILAGHGIRISGAANDFRKLVPQLRIPVVSSWNALDLIPYDSPYFVGTPGVVALRAPNFALQNCDLLISIGSRLDNVITAYNPSNFAPLAKKVIVDIDLDELSKDGVRGDLKIHCDAADFVSKVLTATANKSFDYGSWLKRCQSWKERYSAQNEKRPRAAGVIGHYELVNTLSTLVREDQLIVTGSSGLAVECFYSTFSVRNGQRVFLTSGLGSMGYGLPAAIGGCLGEGKKETILLESDGSFMLNIQELATIKAHQLPIKIIILDNDGYASIRNTQKNYFKERYIASSESSGLFVPDLSEVARAFGVYSTTIRSADLLTDQLREFLDRAGNGLCVIKLASNEMLSPKVSAIPQPDGSIISMPLEDMSPLLDAHILESELLYKPSQASIKARQ